MSDPNRPEQNLSDNEADEVPDEDDFLDENGAQSAYKAYRTSLNQKHSLIGISNYGSISGANTIA